MDKTTFWFNMILGVLIMLAGFILASQFGGDGPLSMRERYLLAAGLGGGMAGSALVSYITSFKKEKKDG